MNQVFTFKVARKNVNNLNNKNNENQNKMWVRTISGWVFFDVTYTIQGMPIIISSKKQLNNKKNERRNSKNDV